MIKLPCPNSRRILKYPYPLSWKVTRNFKEAVAATKQNCKRKLMKVDFPDGWGVRTKKPFVDGCGYILDR